MPLPKPRKNEDKDEFIGRCMGDDTMNEEYPDSDQRRAVCETQWEKKDMKSWYNMKAEGDNAEVSIFDEIGLWGIDASAFKKDWDEIKNKKNITLYLNSPGGDVFDGMAIANMIASKRENVSVEIYGLAASIASVIALAGSKLTMAEATFFMIHNPFGLAIGDSAEMMKMAELLDKMQGEFINVYEAHSEMSRDEIKEAMEAETWFTAEEAQDAGFVDEVIKVEKLAAMNFDWRKYNYAHVPSEMLADTSKPETIRDFEAFLRDAGYSRKEAKSIALYGFQRDAEDYNLAQLLNKDFQDLEDEQQDITDHLVDDGDYYAILTEITECNI